jgi:hypothetical protein
MSAQIVGHRKLNSSISVPSPEPSASTALARGSRVAVSRRVQHGHYGNELLAGKARILNAGDDDLGRQRLCYDGRDRQPLDQLAFATNQ